jgi:hypothetical protein
VKPGELYYRQCRFAQSYHPCKTCQRLQDILERLTLVFNTNVIAVELCVQRNSNQMGKFSWS